MIMRAILTFKAKEGKGSHFFALFPDYREKERSQEILIKWCRRNQYKGQRENQYW